MEYSFFMNLKLTVKTQIKERHRDGESERSHSDLQASRMSFYIYQLVESLILSNTSINLSIINYKLSTINNKLQLILDTQDIAFIYDLNVRPINKKLEILKIF
jgi:hypothetical protein